ncbi:MAG: hypothetical protein KF696_11650 [Planctomycetes bacterium]|nr:hypothetical protein [Planctomycetota bacterium]MCW8135248.1 hypothetical protein [Planctomycetota bacterium]
MAEEDAKSGVIRLRVKDVGQLFNSLDPDPFIERDLDDDAVDYITSWAREIPKHLPVRLSVTLTEQKHPGDHQATLQAAVQNYFGNAAELARNEFRQLLKRGRTSLLIGLIVLGVSMFAAHFVGQALEDRSWGSLVSEGIMIGGWVAMWRPLEILLYDWWPLRRKRLDLQRLRDMKVEVTPPTT